MPKTLERLIVLVNRVREKLVLLFLRARGASVASSVRIYGRVTIIGNLPRLSIGHDTTLNEGVFLNVRDTLKIGSRVHISPSAQIHTGRLTLEILPRVHESAPVIIEDDVWIASGVIISPGVRIGSGSVIGAGSVVTQDVPSRMLFGGIPARAIRPLNIT